MTQSQLSNMRSQFDRYVNRFAGAGGGLHSLLQLKLEHSECVATEARELSSDLGWTLSDQHLADAIGLLHDVGRFSQFAEYGTFSDGGSVDHGERGAAVIEQEGWLAALPDGDRAAILKSVRNHNRLIIPAHIRDRSLAFLCLVRDADKLDIFRVVLDALERDGFRDLTAMLPHVTLDRRLSPAFVEHISGRRCASLGKVNTLADFLLMQAFWAYDLNYPPALKRFQDRGILARILKHLDGDVRIHALVSEVQRHVLKRAGK